MKNKDSFFQNACLALPQSTFVSSFTSQSSFCFNLLSIRAIVEHNEHFKKEKGILTKTLKDGISGAYDKVICTFKDVTRDDSLRRFLAQLLRRYLELLQHFSNIAMLFCAKNRRCE